MRYKTKSINSIDLIDYAMKSEDLQEMPSVDYAMDIYLASVPGIWSLKSHSAYQSNHLTHHVFIWYTGEE